MILIQRKSDGSYWRNITGYHYDKELWTKDMNDCRPFKNTGSARNSRGWQSRKYVRKTYIYALPEWLIEHRLFSHFMRGYFDGDGTHYIDKGSSRNKHAKVAFAICGNRWVMEDFQNKLVSECGIHANKICSSKRHHSDFAVLKYASNVLVGKINAYLYKDAVTFLKRKRDVGELTKVLGSNEF